MKKTLLLSLMAMASISALADYTGPGYYRVQNYKTERWISIIDNRGTIDFGSTSVDLQAIKLQKNFDVVCSDPASILYIKPAGSQFQIEAQGTGIYQIIGHYVNLNQVGGTEGNKYYTASGTLKGVTKYIGDSQFMPEDIGWANTTPKDEKRYWHIKPLTDEGDCFFGVKPTVESAGKFYGSMFGDFPFSTLSEGVKAYCVKYAANGMAVLEPLTGTVAKGTPVIFECNSANPSDNRLHIGGEGTSVSGNKLKGVYFKNDVKTHLNRVAFDPNTMRVLGTLSDGTVGFVTPEDLDYIPANTCYLTVESGSPSEIRIVDYATYLADVDETTEEAAAGPKTVFTLTGVKLYDDASEEQLNSLPAGFYIVGGRKWLKK